MDWFPDYVDISEFAKEYEQHAPAKYLKEKYNISSRQYRLITRELPKRKRVPTRDESKEWCSTLKKPKYYQENPNGTYTIRKYVKRNVVYYGSYDSKDDADKVVAELKKANWDKGKLESILSRLNIKRRDDRTVGR